MRYTLTIEEADWQTLTDHVLQDQQERMTFAYANPAKTQNTTTFLVRKIDLPQDDEYRSHGAANVSLKADRAVPRLFQAREYGAFIDLHSHPFSYRPYPSVTDQIGAQRQLQDLSNTAPETALIRMIIGQGRSAWAEVKAPGERHWQPIDEIILLGLTQRRVVFPVNSPGMRPISQDPLEERTRAVLGESSSGLRHLTIAVIGTGGVGSGVLTQLQGYVDHLILIDPDVVESHNAPRLYGYTDGDEGRPKVDILQSRIRQAFPRVIVEALQASFPSEPTLDAVKRSDLVFCCPDHNSVRYAASLACSRFMKPLIEVGCGGKQRECSITALGYHVRLQVPGGLCLACNGLDLSQLEDPSTTEMKHQAGYVEDGELIRGELAPLTTRAAADAVDIAFRYITGYAPLSRHLYADSLRHQVLDLTHAYRSHPDCPLCGQVETRWQGLGDRLSADHQILVPPGGHYDPCPT